MDRNLRRYFVALYVVGLGAALSAPPSGYADTHTTSQATTFEEAISNGRAYVSARYRYEWVDEDAFTNDARASTLRTRLGYKTARYKGFEGALELEDIHEIGQDDFNNTINGKSDRPTVADVEGSEINQAYLSYFDIPDTEVSFGRKAVNLDNERFIGEVNWRQNNQTLDIASFSNTSLPNLKVWYGHIFNVNRIFGENSTVGDLRSNSDLVNLKYSVPDFGSITPYAYFLDFETLPALSSMTYGARVDGKLKASESLSLIVDGEYAYQQEYRDNPTDYSADYIHGALGFEVAGFTIKGGYEVLGSDSGVTAFQTPLATLHKWNGWTDKFLTTPATGLRDAYGSISYKASGINDVLDGTVTTVAYHSFDADEGSTTYGDEWNVEVTRQFLSHYLGAITYVHYNADEFSTDTDKIIFSLHASFSQ